MAEPAVVLSAGESSRTLVLGPTIRTYTNDAVVSFTRPNHTQLLRGIPQPCVVQSDVGDLFPGELVEFDAFGHLRVQLREA